jgi:hypothetical protein
VFRIKIETDFGDRIWFLSAVKRVRETPTQLGPIGTAIPNPLAEGFRIASHRIET